MKNENKKVNDNKKRGPLIGIVFIGIAICLLAAGIIMINKPNKVSKDNNKTTTTISLESKLDDTQTKIDTLKAKLQTELETARIESDKKKQAYLNTKFNTDEQYAAEREWEKARSNVNAIETKIWDLEHYAKSSNDKEVSALVDEYNKLKEEKDNPSIITFDNELSSFKIIPFIIPAIFFVIVGIVVMVSSRIRINSNGIDNFFDQAKKLNEDEVVICSYCGTKNKKTADKCKNCGAAL
jgi:chromosome segregation ATPase